MNHNQYALPCWRMVLAVYAIRQCRHIYIGSWGSWGTCCCLITWSEFYIIWSRPTLYSCITIEPYRLFLTRGCIERKHYWFHQRRFPSRAWEDVCCLSSGNLRRVYMMLSQVFRKSPKLYLETGPSDGSLLELRMFTRLIRGTIKSLLNFNGKLSKASWISKAYFINKRLFYYIIPYTGNKRKIIPLTMRWSKNCSVHMCMH